MKRFIVLVTLTLALAAFLGLSPAYADLTAGNANLQTEKAGMALKTTATGNAAPVVSYQTHVQNDGWQGWKSNGKTAGTTGRSLRLEGIRIKLANASGGITYRTHVQNIGWESSWKSDGKTSGTSGRSLRLEAIQIKLTGDVAKDYDVYYRVHCQNIGWMGWAKNGAMAGSAGYSYRLEGIEIKLVAKGANPSLSTANAFKNKAGFLSGVPDSESYVVYRTHVQNVGWQNYMRDGQTAGTSGRSLRLEGINVKLGGKAKGNILYRTHVQNIGWEGNWKSNGAQSGTNGRSLRLEAIQIKLTGDVAKDYDVYYRVHCQNIGWMGWAKNGERAGTSGYSYRLEAIQIKLVKKTAAPPKSNAPTFTSRGSELGRKVADIAVAEYRIGERTGDYHEGGKKYWSMFDDRYEAWCSEFAAWCMVKAGMVPGENMPWNPTYANAYVRYYSLHPELGTVHKNDGTYYPQKGDICIHVDGSGDPSHTEICVESYANGEYVDVSGNRGDCVRMVTRDLPNTYVGYYITLAD